MRSIWQKQSGGLFRSKCLVSLCSITPFCRWSSTFSPALQFELPRGLCRQYKNSLIGRRIKF